MQTTTVDKVRNPRMDDYDVLAKDKAGKSLEARCRRAADRQGFFVTKTRSLEYQDKGTPFLLRDSHTGNAQDGFISLETLAGQLGVK